MDVTITMNPYLIVTTMLDDITTTKAIFLTELPGIQNSVTPNSLSEMKRKLEELGILQSQEEVVDAFVCSRMHNMSSTIRTWQRERKKVLEEFLITP